MCPASAEDWDACRALLRSIADGFEQFLFSDLPLDIRDDYLDALGYMITAMLWNDRADPEKGGRDTIPLSDDDLVLRAMRDKTGTGTEAGNAAEALDAVRMHAPDCVLMDISMRDIHGIELTRQLVATTPRGSEVVGVVPASPLRIASSPSSFAGRLSFIQDAGGRP